MNLEPGELQPRRETKEAHQPSRARWGKGTGEVPPLETMQDTEVSTLLLLDCGSWSLRPTGRGLLAVLQ